MKSLHPRALVGLALLVAALGCSAAPNEQTSTADHSKFEELQQPFEDGPAVTRACLGCHTEAANQVHESIHWTWDFKQPSTGQRLGKRFVVNNFCLSLTANYARCTSCHVGYGWKDGNFDFTSQENVDCLVCHDTTGTYVKFPTGAGHPPYEDKKFQGKLIKAPDLTKVAQNVGKTSRETCGTCHFKGGGGEAVKHGDMDSSLLAPPKAVDVHMSPDGLDFTCATCHEFTNHDQQGSRYLMKAKSQGGVSVPGRESERPACESCHGLAPHPVEPGNKLNDHVDKVACQTCHIPEFARGGHPTKLWWDWETAGKLDDKGKPIVEKKDGVVVYHGKKGTFEWGENVEPEYHWFDGTVRYTLLGEAIDPTGKVELNQLEGGPEDANARIWPFKVMAGRQPYDKGNDFLVVTHLFGKDDAAFWKSFDWDKAVAAGMEEAKKVGQTTADYSGEYGFTETLMYWPITHMVAPADEALGCASCHAENGRLAELTGFYMPGRDGFTLTDKIGWILVAATLLGVLVHGLGRLVLGRRKA
jgi:octaheme c-type cytochrome (tetrathionate reductase family)